MICESTSLSKYINKSSNIFFVFGPEIVLKNNSVDLINSFLKEKSFNEKKIITESDYSKIESTILENASGSLFGSKIIIEINHLKGKIPKEIVNIFEMQDIKKFNDIAIIIKSSIEKINKNTKWVKLLDSLGLIVECNKLKSYEEKAWVKNQLNFMNESDARDYSTRIADIFSGNLIAQQNEIVRIFIIGFFLSDLFEKYGFL